MQAWGGLEHLDGQLANLLSLHRLRASLTYSTNLPWHVYGMVFKNTPNPCRPAKEVGPASPTLARLGPSFVPRHPFVSYSLWLCLILDIMKICMDFGPYDVFPSSDVPKMVDQQNSWISLVISTYLLYLEWNVGMLVVNICILWPPTLNIAIMIGYLAWSSKRVSHLISAHPSIMISIINQIQASITGGAKLT
jgi:hypothetical protein